jgi:N-acetylglucosaminyldiphosphoundecaprenol N-acetyl-beta-D-mannosaminyltransferase
MTPNLSFNIGGVRIHALPSEEVSRLMVQWCTSAGIPKSVVFVNAFSIVTATKDRQFLAALNSADLSVADGVPVAWAGSQMTGVHCDRLSGPDLMHCLLTKPEHAHVKHFVYGGSQEALDRLEFRYNRGGLIKPLRIVGTYSPPFQGLSHHEEKALVGRLAALKPDILWVCLGTARQEKWMARMRSELSVPVMAGVGAAVDFLSGQKSRAPRWMQKAGLEWFFRLVNEPRRLWRRYFFGNVLFLCLVVPELWKHYLARRQQA